MTRCSLPGPKATRIDDIRTLTRHPVSAAFPDLDAATFAAMVEDMRDTGYDRDNPILVLNDQVVAGWHRYLAAIQARVEPTYKDLPDDTDPATLAQTVTRSELNRRHLRPGERARLIVETKIAAGLHPRPKGRVPLGEEDRYFDVDEAAGEAGVAGRTIRRELARRDGREPQIGQPADLARLTRAELVERIRELERQVTELTGSAPKDPSPASWK